MKRNKTIRTYSEPVEVSATVVPFNGEELQNTDEGQYSTEDRLIFTSEVFKNGDLISKSVDNFEIRKVYDFSEFVNLNKYLGKKLGEGEVSIGDTGEVTYNYNFTEFVNEFENR